LTGEERAAVSAARGRLALVKRGEDAAAIRNATLALDQATRRFAELMMEAAVTTAIRGKTMVAAGEELAEAVTAPHAMAPAEFK
jgi:acyl CoA:acetate/3-ketoacid CoA transferase alpha subunit